MTGGEVPVVALGLIRLCNGVLALFAPGLLLRALGSSEHAGSPATYILRMFGVRTIFLGLDLLAGSAVDRREAVDRAPIIHATDALAALTAGLTRQLTPRVAATAVGISSVNLALAVVARRTPGFLPRR